MWKNLICVFALSGIVFSGLGSAWAGPYDPIISNPAIGETMPGQTTATLQLSLTTIKAVTLLSVSSPLAESIEIQRISKQKGKMQTEVLESLFLPANRTIPFATHGLYLMVKGIKQPLNSGDRMPISVEVVFADQQKKTLTTEAVVKKMELGYKHYGDKDIYDHRQRP